MKRNFLVWVFLPGFCTVLSSAQVDISPGVARISLIQGEVSARCGDTGDWAAAALNQPLVGGDRISTGDGSKAEVQLDHSNILRLGNNTQVKIATVERAKIERAQIQVQVGQGLAYYTVFEDSEAEVEIDTPNAAVRPTSKEGIYRIEVNGFETHVIVRAGAADISTPQGSTHVETGQAATVRGTTDEAGSVLGGAPSNDSWDSWNNDRDGEIRNAQSWNYTNRYYVGSEDLDAYGHWINVPDYGRVWAPTVAGNWSPYRAGRWVSEPHWGWIWVSHEPWGWTPYHSGSWAYCDNVGWGWSPDEDGGWYGLNNVAALTPIGHTSGGSGHTQPPRLPGHPPLPHAPSMIAVNTKPIAASQIASSTSFVFRKDSAGLGVPRGTLGNLNKFSHESISHGTASTAIYASVPRTGQFSGSLGKSEILATSIHRGSAPSFNSSSSQSSSGSSYAGSSIGGGGMRGGGTTAAPAPAAPSMPSGGGGGGKK